MSSTTAKCFVDTNVIIYAFIQHGDPRSTVARSLLRELSNGLLVVSTQVLAEFAQVALTKARRHADEVERLMNLRRFAEIVVVEPSDIATAVRLHGETSISVWDALIVAAALKAGCDRIYTEDLNHGQSIRSVRIVNPFVQEGATS